MNQIDPSSPGQQIAGKIRNSPDGEVGFRQFMQWALYDEEAGYYSSGRGAPGKDGDFFTSASVGECFGNLLALHLVEAWETMGSPAEFTLIEQGANDGRLTADLAVAVARSAPQCFAALRILLIEPQPTLKDRQKTNLSSLEIPTEWVDRPSSIPEGTRGLFLANELLDAFPVDLVRWNGQVWQERVVKEDGAGGLVFGDDREPEKTLSTLIEASLKGNHWPENYQTEIHGDLVSWVDEITASPFQGHVLLFDYGFTAADYRHPGRTEGTLKRIRDHQNHNDLLTDPGESDLTAHVDWSLVASEFQKNGATVAGYLDQGSFLVRVAEPWLLSLEKDGTAPNPEIMGQFQTLIHPSFLGRSFQVMSLWLDEKEEARKSSLRGFRDGENQLRHLEAE